MSAEVSMNQRRQPSKPRAGISELSGSEVTIAAFGGSGLVLSQATPSVQ